MYSHTNISHIVWSAGIIRLVVAENLTVTLADSRVGCDLCELSFLSQGRLVSLAPSRLVNTLYYGSYESFLSLIIVAGHQSFGHNSLTSVILNEV